MKTSGSRSPGWEIFKKKEVLMMRMQEQETEKLFVDRPETKSTSDLRKKERFAVILAGGDEPPLYPFIAAGSRRERPAHFCRTYGSDFIINQTRRRVEMVFPPEKIMFVVTREHARYYEKVLADVPRENLIVQPQDDGTTFAVCYAAMRLKHLSPSAVITFFPADFRVPDIQSFIKQIDPAVSAADLHSSLVLLGTKADNPDAGRGWIEPDSITPLNETLNLWRIRNLALPADTRQAMELIKAGALSNSGVMVGEASTFLAAIRDAAPEVFAKFKEVQAKMGTPAEEAGILRAFYSNFVETDFTRDVLAKGSDKLAVIPVPASISAAAGVNRPVFAAKSPAFNNRQTAVASASRI